jgi:two-component system, response regulator RegA
MARILLIDDDEICLDITGKLLTLHGHQFSGARTGRDGVCVAREWNPDVALVDLRLPDTTGIEVLAELKSECPGTACVLFSAYATLDSAVQAMRAGACDCLTKPAFEEDIIMTVERVLAQQPETPGNGRREPPLVPPEAHAAARWAQPIARAVEAHHDPRTLREFGRAVFVSVGCFRNWCRTAGVSPRASLSFARALRAVYRFEQDGSTRPENILSIVDQRTIAKFVKKCGGDGDHLPNTVTQFLAEQQFIGNREAVEAVRTALRSPERRAAKYSTVKEIVAAADARRRGSSP